MTGSPHACSSRTGCVTTSSGRAGGSRRRAAPWLWVLAALWLSACGGASSGLSAADAEVRLAPAGGKVSAGYLRLHNASDRDLRVMRATSPAFGKVEIHEMTMADGMMRMRRLDFLRVPAGDSVLLEPGGRHLMLFEPRPGLEAGEGIVLALHYRFDDGEPGSEGAEPHVLEVPARLNGYGP